MPIRKQLSIKKAFKRARLQQSDDSNDLREEVEQLEQLLKQKQNEWFELQKESYRRKISAKKNTSECCFPYSQTELTVTKNEVQKLKDSIFTISMLSGMEVQSFEENDHCTVVFHMQHTSENVVKHGLKIDLRNGRECLLESSLPLGFNLTALEEYDSIMSPKCLGAIRNALITYYNRLEQFEQLKKSFFVDAQFFKTLDTSYIEISFKVFNERNPDEDSFGLALVLEYRVHDIRPKHYDVKNIDYVMEHIKETILQQCIVFKEKSLLKAFTEAFVTGVGPYKLVSEVFHTYTLDGPPKSPEGQPRRRPAPHRAAYRNNDDTFHPEAEEDSDTDDDEEV